MGVELLPGESLAYGARLLWTVLFFPLPVLVYLFFGAPGIFFLIGGLQSLKDPNTDAWAFIWAGIFDIWLTAIVVMAVVMRRKRAKFLVTNKRVILKSGIIKPHAVEVPLEEIRSVNVYPDGLFNAGIVPITGTGGTTIPFRHVSNALEFRRQVQEQLTMLAANRNFANLRP